MPTRAQLIEDFADVFAPREAPISADPLHITLHDDAVPMRVNGARNVPLALKNQLIAALQEQEHNGLKRQVIHPTEWCSPIVGIPEKGQQKSCCCRLQRAE